MKRIIYLLTLICMLVVVSKTSVYAFNTDSNKVPEETGRSESYNAQVRSTTKYAKGSDDYNNKYNTLSGTNTVLRKYSYSSEPDLFERSAGGLRGFIRYRLFEKRNEQAATNVLNDFK